jgi:hypothetical protein
MSRLSCPEALLDEKMAKMSILRPGLPEIKSDLFYRIERRLDEAYQNLA